MFWREQGAPRRWRCLAFVIANMGVSHSQSSIQYRRWTSVKCSPIWSVLSIFLKVSMSFARAKRFNYQNPELKVSPADYYICSSLDKLISIHKCPRYGNPKCQSESGMSCSRLCSTPSSSQPGRLNSTYSSSRPGSKRSSCARLDTSSTRSSSTAHRANLSLPANKTNVKELISNFENLMSTCETVSSQEFFDDDYFSYASSDELGHLKRIEEYELNEVRRAYEKLARGRSNGNEGLLLRKMEGIESVLRQFGRDLAGIGDRLEQIEHLQKDQVETVKNVETMQVHFEGMSDDRKLEITDMIRRAIDYLNAQFENRKLKLLHKNETQLLNVLQEMHRYHDASIGEMGEICKDTAADLTKGLIKALSSHHLDIDCTQEAEGRLHDSFNYENICKILSEHLEITKDEISILEQDSMDITLKYSAAQEALEAQTTFLEQLQTEITTLKNEVDN